MPFIEWIPEYEIGHEEIDAQHRHVAELVNKLHDAAVSGRGETVLAETLRELVEYSKVHFAEEEAFAMEYAKEELEPQRQAHRDLTANLAQILRLSTESRGEAAGRLTVVMKAFFLKHVLRMDKRLKPYVPRKKAA